MEATALREGAAVAVELAGWAIAVARVDGVPRAAINRCTHAAAAFLPGGRVRRGVLMCPAHGARFEISDGRCVGSLYQPLRTFACREVAGWIEIDVPDEAPAPNERPVTR
jgi:3-phenylpropionate/trans-cinnamate dioxygenase ferredoxin subunit